MRILALLPMHFAHSPNINTLHSNLIDMDFDAIPFEARKLSGNINAKSSSTFILQITGSKLCKKIKWQMQQWHPLRIIAGMERRRRQHKWLKKMQTASGAAGSRFAYNHRYRLLRFPQRLLQQRFINSRLNIQLALIFSLKPAYPSIY